MSSNNPVPAPTSRLRLRPWRPSDKLLFRQMNADPRVMEYFLAPLNDAESDALADRIMAHQAAHGFCLWAVELRATETFIGFTGLAIPRWDPPFAPCVEIGWRLAYEYWGKGYATEAARSALTFGFDVLHLDEIVAFSATINQRSQRVMQRLGMQYAKDEDFYHSAIPRTHPLARHVLYRLSRARWEKTSSIQAQKTDHPYPAE